MAEFGQAGARGGQLRPGRPAAGAHARRVDLGRGAGAQLPRARALRAGAVKPSPILTGLKTYPFVRLTDAKRELVARGVEVVDFGIGEPREDTAPFIREALAASLDAAVDLPARRGAAGAARGGRRLDRAPLRADARPGHRGPPHARLQGGDLPPRAGRRRRLRGRHRRPATRSPSAAPRSPASRCSSSRWRPSAASCPTSTPSTPPPGTARRSCGSTTRTTRPPRARRSSSTSARREIAREHDFVRRLRRGLLGDLLRRRAAGLGARGRRPPQRRSRSTRSPSARRCPATAPASWPATPR